MQLGLNGEEYEGEGIETNIRYILLFLDNLFNLATTSYSRSVIENLRLAYGFEKLNKLKRLRRSEPIESEEEVIPFGALEQLLSEDEPSYSEAHKTCLFDAVNAELVKFKPYYESVGECFPWSLSICPSITFYEINQQTLGVVLNEAKAKVIEASSTLCGLMTDVCNEQEEIRLKIRRIEREDHMFKRQLRNEEHLTRESVELEMRATIILTKASEQVCQSLAEELALELAGG